jgi:MFS transporter, DHA1 family, inner membrane transport protein
VVIGAPSLIALGSRVPRRALLIALMGLFVVGNLGAALAPSFGWLFAARVVSALPHGAVFGLGAVIAVELSGPRLRAEAISMALLGLTVASCVGAPLATLVGQALSWRAAFGLIVILGVAGMVALALLLPPLPRSGDVTLRRELAVVMRPRVLLALGIAVVGFAGIFAAIGYVTPIMTNVAGFPASAGIWAISLFGLGLTAGNVLSPRLQRATAGRIAPTLMMALIFAALAVVLAAFVGTAHVPALAVVTVFAIGLIGFTAIPVLQSQLIDMAQGAPTMTSASMHSAFNLGNALGPLVGGMAIAAGLGDASASGAGAVMSACGVALALGAVALDRRVARRAGASAPAAS